MLINETIRILGNTTNIIVNDVSLEQNTFEQDTTETLIKKYKEKIQQEARKNKDIASNNISEKSKKSGNRIVVELVYKNYKDRNAISRINSYSRCWLMDADDNVRIPPNKNTRTNGDLFIYDKISSMDNSNLKVRYPKKYANSATNKYAFNEYRSDAQKLINEWRAAYFLKPIEKDLDQITKEEYTSEHFLLENIKARMENKEYPIFVTAGNGYEKLSHIVHNKYLANCYESLSTIGGSLICYGFGFGNYDEHIIAAINNAGKKRKDENDKWLPFLASIYIGVYSEADLKHIKSIERKFKVPVRVFDAKTVNVWG
jgi:hypothetical protein